eukprot:s2650_g12.t1
MPERTLQTDCGLAFVCLLPDSVAVLETAVPSFLDKVQWPGLRVGHLKPDARGSVDIVLSDERLGMS